MLYGFLRDNDGNFNKVYYNPDETLTQVSFLIEKGYGSYKELMELTRSELEDIIRVKNNNEVKNIEAEASNS